ncbi:MAG: histidine kinase [Chitinophagaceae bacterium]
MRKYFLIVPLLFFYLPLVAQLDQEEKINKLKKTLPLLKGTIKVDCLNAISEQYFNVGFFGENDKRVDSIEMYAAKANKEAEELNYLNGIVNAQLYTAFAEILRRKFNTAEDRLRRLLSITNTNNNISGHANSFLANIYGDTYNKTDQAIEFLKKSLYHFRRINNQRDEGLTLTRLCMLYTRKGDYETGVEYCTRGVTLAKKLADDGNRDGWVDYQVGQSLALISNLYQLAGDYSAAKDYMHQARQYFSLRNRKIDDNSKWATLYYLEGKYDSAIHYYNLHLLNNPEQTGTKMDLGKSYLSSRDYQKALQFLKESVDLFRKRTSDPTRPRAKINLMHSLLYAAQAYYEINHFNEASKHATEGLQLLKEIKNLLPIDQYELFSKAYHYTGNHDSAYLYLQKYNSEKQSVLSKQFLFKLNNYKREAEDERKAAQIALLSKDNLIKAQQLQQQALLKEQREAEIALLDKDNKIKEQQLKQQLFLKQQKEAQIALLDKNKKLLEKDIMLKQQLMSEQSFQNKVLIAGMFVFVLICLVILRNLALKRRNDNLRRQRLENELVVQQLENEKKHAELQQQATELEMQALRAQMNPHFIFNCLSSINRFILKNETEAASDYLTRFSRLIRMVLINSQKSLIPLEDELEMLRLYLNMERLRFNNAFDYNITFSNDLEVGSIFIPPLLLQPFCENAIWHGLMNKQEHGHLNIALGMNEGILNCIIIDNGIGRQKAAMLKSKSIEKGKSLGLKITADRLALLNQDKGIRTSYEIEDVADENGNVAGTKVHLKIRYRESVEVYA